MMKFNLGFLCGGLFTIAIMALFMATSPQSSDFPPRKPPVTVHSRDCYIGDKIKLAPSNAVFISMGDL